MAHVDSWAPRLAARLYERRGAALVGTVLLTLLAAVPAMQVQVDTAVQHWFTEGDPALQAYLDFQAPYGNDEVGLDRPAGTLTARDLTVRKCSVDGPVRPAPPRAGP
jgi:hypothetical protein